MFYVIFISLWPLKLPYSTFSSHCFTLLGFPETTWRRMFTISPTVYVNNICHRILGFVLLCSLAGEVCSTVLWPAGKYGLPMPKSGCPKSNGFYWNSGYIFQDLEDTNSLTSASPNSYLHGWVQGDVVQYYCIKNNASAAVDSKRSRWPKGQYCIYQKGPSCPAGLLSGSMLWDDENSPTGKNKNLKAGVLPEGVYNQDTKIFFCCTVTGSHQDPIKLPVSSPFYLIAFTSYCQEVLNTVHTMEYITYDTEDDNNHDQKIFPYPYGVSQLEPTIYYCYYKACAWTMTALSGTFWSPYYPQDYKSRHSCTWRINVPWNYTISVTFEDVTLERRCCQCDYVELWETLSNGSAVLIGKFCDETKPDTSYQFKSIGNNVTVIFYSDTSVEAKGFKASYKAIPGPALTTSSTSASTGNSNGTRSTTPSYVTTTADATKPTALNSNGTSASTTIPSYVTTTAGRGTSISASTANSNGTRPMTTTPSYVTTTASKATSTSASTANNKETRQSTTKLSSVTTTERTTSKVTTVVEEQNGTTTAPFTHIPPGTPEFTTGRETTSGSSSFTKEFLQTDLTSEQRISATEPGRSITTERSGVYEPRKESASTGSAFVIVGVIGSLIVIGGALAGTLFWFCKKRNIKKNNNGKSKLAVSFTLSDKTFGMTNISSWDMYQGRGFVSKEGNDYEDYATLERKYDTCTEPAKESDNPMYGRDCLVTAAVTFGFNDDEVKKSENPMYVRDSPVVSVKAQYIDVGKGSDNHAYVNDYLETSPKKGYEKGMKQSENPLYASSPETAKQSENPLYESMDDNLKGTVEDGIYSSLYERMIIA